MKFQEIISIIFFPSIIAIIVSIIFSLVFPQNLGKLTMLTSIGIGILLLAAVPSIPVLCYLRKHSDVYNNFERNKRRKFYLIGLVSYLLATIIFWYTNTHPMFCLSAAYLCVAIAFVILNHFIKLSAHAGGIAGPVTALVYVFGIKFLPLYLLVLFIIWNRLKLEAHTVKESIIGAVVPIFITFIVYLILW
jgi:hypothetical protein